MKRIRIADIEQMEKDIFHLRYEYLEPIKDWELLDYISLPEGKVI